METIVERIITGRYNRYGYVIEVDGEEVYRAGNHPLESSQVIEPTSQIGHPMCTVPLETLAEWCQQTAEEIAEEVNGNSNVGSVEYYLGAAKL